ncbi:hypothetical protein K474DRAFT_1662562 [Panus rudis PR-1116 ss-1]|nr:hypothetical protein K474DRAFT_1662562 [Panus rudis PR-1116 ss-1]
MNSTVLPDAGAIEKASKIEVFDANGQAVEFGTLIDKRETIVVFIRHFFCGACQAYVSELSSVRPEALDKANKDLIIIGCGDYTLIKNYAETTQFRGIIYADPSRSLYRIFGLTESLERTPAGKQKRGYLAGQSFLGNVLSSIWKGPLMHPHHIGKQGKLSQLGGEFIFGPGKACSYASRMQHTEDHVDVSELMQEANVEYP